MEVGGCRVGEGEEDQSLGLRMGVGVVWRDASYWRYPSGFINKKISIKEMNIFSLRLTDIMLLIWPHAFAGLNPVTYHSTW